MSTIDEWPEDTWVDEAEALDVPGRRHVRTFPASDAPRYAVGTPHYLLGHGRVVVTRVEPCLKNLGLVDIELAEI